jgi:hypothetical protein
MLLLAGCGTPSVSATSVDLKEFSVTPVASTLAPGEVELTAHNSGEFPHTLVVSHSDGTVVGGTEMIGSGETARLVLTLATGSYLLTCRIVGQMDTGELVDHYERGMVARVEVTSPSS